MAGVKIDRRGADLQAAHLALQPDHLDFVALGGGFPGEAAADVLAHQLGVFRRHQIRQAASDELHAIDADQARELPVGVQDHLPVQQHCLVNAVAQVGEQSGCLGGIALRAASGAPQQVIDGRDQARDFSLVAAAIQPLGDRPAGGDAQQLLRQLPNAVQLATLQPIEHQEQSGDERQQQAQQPKDRHLPSSSSLPLGFTARSCQAL